MFRAALNKQKCVLRFLNNSVDMPIPTNGFRYATGYYLKAMLVEKIKHQHFRRCNNLMNQECLAHLLITDALTVL